MFRRYGVCLAAVLWLGSALPLRAEVRVTSEDALKSLVKRVEPEYPAIAKQMRVVGKVTVDITVETDGSVSEVKVTSGNPLLTSTVVGTVKKWKFTPFTGANGEPTKVITSLDFDFKF